MGILDRLAPATRLAASPPVGGGSGVVDLAADPDPVAVADTVNGATSPFTEGRAYAIALQIARSIPAVRKAEHVIAGTLGTFRLVGVAGGQQLDPADPRCAWLAQPDPSRTSQWILTRTVLDLIWFDRSVWQIIDRTILGAVVGARRVHPDRVDVIRDPRDPDTVQAWIIDGREYRDPISAGFIIFDAAGLGGLRTFGYDLLTVYGQLQTAAGRYAKAPHPYAILKNHGADLDRAEIDALLTSWDAARGERGVGYTNDVIEYLPQQGWSAQELQLTEAREHAAVEVARLFGLPAFSLDAKGGEPMTYATIVDRRKDQLHALTPWRAVIEQTLSMDDRRVVGRPRGVVLPHGVSAQFDTEAYTREDAAERMKVWRDLIDLKLATAEDISRLEPLSGRKPL